MPLLTTIVGFLGHISPNEAKEDDPVPGIGAWMDGRASHAQIPGKTRGF